eukprot:PhM_4_TR14888/c0_g1_i1/m.107130
MSITIPVIKKHHTRRWLKQPRLLVITPDDRIENCLPNGTVTKEFLMIDVLEVSLRLRRPKPNRTAGSHENDENGKELVITYTCDHPFYYTLAPPLPQTQQRPLTIVEVCHMLQRRVFYAKQRERQLNMVNSGLSATTRLTGSVASSHTSALLMASRASSAPPSFGGASNPIVISILERFIISVSAQATASSTGEDDAGASSSAPTSFYIIDTLKYYHNTTRELLILKIHWDQEHRQYLEKRKKWAKTASPSNGDVSRQQRAQTVLETATTSSSSFAFFRRTKPSTPQLAATPPTRTRRFNSSDNQIQHGHRGADTFFSRTARPTSPPPLSLRDFIDPSDLVALMQRLRTALDTLKEDLVTIIIQNTTTKNEDGDMKNAPHDDVRFLKPLFGALAQSGDEVQRNFTTAAEAPTTLSPLLEEALQRALFQPIQRVLYLLLVYHAQATACTQATTRVAEVLESPTTSEPETDEALLDRLLWGQLPASLFDRDPDDDDNSADGKQLLRDDFYSSFGGSEGSFGFLRFALAVLTTNFVESSSSPSHNNNISGSTDVVVGGGGNLLLFPYKTYPIQLQDKLVLIVKNIMLDFGQHQHQHAVDRGTVGDDDDDVASPFTMTLSSSASSLSSDDLLPLLVHLIVRSCCVTSTRDSCLSRPRVALSIAKFRMYECLSVYFEHLADWGDSTERGFYLTLFTSAVNFVSGELKGRGDNE